MYKDSYNQRLKEIREKYGASIKDTTSCIRTNEKPTLRSDSKYDDKYGDKYGINRKLHDTKSEWKSSQNIDPSFTSFSSKYSSSILKENEAFLPTQSKDERLKEIEKIRKEFAESRNKAVEDFNRNLENSKSKFTQNSGLKQRVNRTTTTFNPEEFRSAVKETPSYEAYRGRSHSTITSVRIQPDSQLSQELRRNYDYNYAYESSEKGLNVHERNDLDVKHFNSFRNNSVSRYDRENSSIARKNSQDYVRIENFRTNIQIDSETTSPIRGLMKLDSLEKFKKTEISEGYLSATTAKLSSNTYDLTNIDKIQDRIHKILAKK